MDNVPLKGLSNNTLKAIAARFRALGELNRLRLIQALRGGEKSVFELVEATGLSQPNVSRHLALLLTARLVDRRKEGLTVRYRVVDDSLAEICSVMRKAIFRQQSRR